MLSQISFFKSLEGNIEKISILTNHEALNFKLHITKLQCTSRAVFETFELPM